MIRTLKRKAHIAASLALALVTITACQSTNYTRHGDMKAAGQGASGMLERQIDYTLNPEIFSYAPTCVFTTPLPNPVVTRAVERQLYVHFQRVISANSLKRIERKHAVQVNDAYGQKTVARLERCPVMVTLKPYNMDNTYAVVWSRISVGFEVALTHVESGKTLWAARHSDSKSSGGLPLSLFSAPLDTFRATSNSGDQEHQLALMDSVLRRMFHTLPDFR